MKHVGVFCGSHLGKNPIFSQMAAQLGELLVKRDYTLVYGGSSWGLMGVLATQILEHGGHIIGIVPDFFSENVIEQRAITLQRVTSMAERKEKMANIADVFIALPGGIGTLDEITEIMSMNQLGLHAKPIGLLNCDGFYDPFLKQLDNMHQEELIHEVHRNMIVAADTPHKLLEQLEQLEMPNQDQWFKVIKK